MRFLKKLLEPTFFIANTWFSSAPMIFLKIAHFMHFEISVKCAVCKVLKKFNEGNSKNLG